MLRKNHVRLSEPGDLFRCKDLGTDIEYVAFPNLPMGDWDFADPSHPSGSVTIPNRHYVVGILRRDAHVNPHHVWRVYCTPAGVRAFLTSAWWDGYDHKAYDQLAKDLWVDPYYREKTKEARAWWCRVSPKPGRRGDFVAKYWTTVAGKRGKEAPGAVKIVQEHDALCGRQFTFKHPVMVRCQLCPENWYGRVHSCDYCHGKGFRVIVVPREEIGLVRAITQDSGADDLKQIWADRLLDRDVDAKLVEMVRNSGYGCYRSVFELYRPTPTPAPVVGTFTQWA